MKKIPAASAYEPLAGLLKDIRVLIEEARHQTVADVNVGLTLLYWRMGQRIKNEELGNERAVYGEQIVATLSQQLVADLWTLLCREKSATYGSIRTSLPGRADCRDTVTTIELESFSGSPPS